jgi:serine/threonine-protein kinase
MGCGSPRPVVGWGEILGPGDTLDRHYRVDRVLALAGGGVTYAGRALDPSGTEFGPELALKVLYAHRDAGEHLTRLATEAQALRTLAHPHIVECHGFVHRSGAAPYLVTRFEHGGTLAEHLARVGPLRPDVAAACALQILRALQQAHARSVVHRDLKPQNVLLERPCERDEVPHLRVADFGIAKVLGTADGITRLGAFIGTPEYAAPEQFMGHAATPSMDLFALGACFFTMLTGRPAFVPRDRHDVVGCLGDLLAVLPPQLPEPRSPAWRAAQAVVDAVMQPAADARVGVDELGTLLDAVGGATREDAADGSVALSEGATLAPMDAAGAPAAAGWTWVDVVTRFPSRTDASSDAASAVVAASPPTPLHALRNRTSVTAQVVPPPQAVAPSAVPDDADPEAALSLDALVAGFAPARPLVTRTAAPPVGFPAPAAGSRAFDTSADTLVAPVAPRPPAPARADVVPVVAETPSPSAHPAPFGEGEGAPVALPGEPGALLALLGRLAGHEEPTMRAAVERLGADPRSLSNLAAAHRPGGDPAQGVGLCRFAILASRSDWTSRLRALLVDPHPRVRAAACAAIGAVGTVQGLSALPSVSRDVDAEVRVACVWALVSLASRHRRADLVRPPLESLARDVDRTVVAAATAGLRQIGGG